MNQPLIPHDDAWPADWESARVQNLLDFANTTPDQKVQWLGEMLELLNSLQKQGNAGERPSEKKR